VSLRFEDDFSVFVSAPPPQEGEEKTDDDRSMGFLAADDGFRYRTLGSVSDFGGSDAYDRLEDEEDMPGIREMEQVFGVLQEYKTEMAGIQDEEERRKAAARVALGLVYGVIDN
jgi:hypothetical protein